MQSSQSIQPGSTEPADTQQNARAPAPKLKSSCDGDSGRVIVDEAAGVRSAPPSRAGGKEFCSTRDDRWGLAKALLLLAWAGAEEDGGEPGG